MNKSFLKFLAVVFWIVVWWIIAKIADTFLFPSPEETLNALYHIVVGGGFLTTLATSLLRILIGFFLSSLLGMILGILSGLNESFDIFITPVMAVIKSVPVISLILIILFWTQATITPIVVCLLMCLPVMVNAVYDGIKNVDQNLIAMANVYKMSKSETTKHIYYHSIKPYFFTATKACLNLGFRVTIAAEVLSNPKYGLGRVLFDAKVYLNIADLFAWTAIIVFCSYLFELLLKNVIRLNSVKGVSS